MPIAHLEAFYPYFLGNISKLASPLKQWVPGHPEVRWSRFVSSKKPCFRHNFWTETLISPIFTTSTPPLAIHGWKAMDLSFNLAPSYRDLKHPTSRQNFANTSGNILWYDLRLWLNQLNNLQFNSWTFWISQKVKLIKFDKKQIKTDYLCPSLHLSHNLFIKREYKPKI